MSLGHIVVLIWIVLVSLHIVPVYQWLYSLLEVWKRKIGESGWWLKSVLSRAPPGGLTGNLSWLYSSVRRRLWLRVFLIFMILKSRELVWWVCEPACLSFYKREKNKNPPLVESNVSSGPMYEKRRSLFLFSFMKASAAVPRRGVSKWGTRSQ